MSLRSCCLLCFALPYRIKYWCFVNMCTTHVQKLSRSNYSPASLKNRTCSGFPRFTEQTGLSWRVMGSLAILLTELLYHQLCNCPAHQSSGINLHHHDPQTLPSLTSSTPMTFSFIYSPLPGVAFFLYLIDIVLVLVSWHLDSLFILAYKDLPHMSPGWVL